MLLPFVATVVDEFTGVVVPEFEPDPHPIKVKAMMQQTVSCQTQERMRIILITLSSNNRTTGFREMRCIIRNQYACTWKSPLCQFSQNLASSCERMTDVASEIQSNFSAKSAKSCDSCTKILGLTRAADLPTFCLVAYNPKKRPSQSSSIILREVHPDHSRNLIYACCLPRSGHCAATRFSSTGLGSGP